MLIPRTAAFKIDEDGHIWVKVYPYRDLKKGEPIFFLTQEEVLAMKKEAADDVIRELLEKYPNARDR